MNGEEILNFLPIYFTAVVTGRWPFYFFQGYTPGTKKEEDGYLLHQRQSKKIPCHTRLTRL